MPHYLLFMNFSETYAERRHEFRDAHLKKGWASVERGELILAGALTDPADTGVLLFHADTEAVVAQFASEDPYVDNGLVSSWSIREWSTVIGHDATTPLPPAS